MGGLNENSETARRFQRIVRLADFDVESIGEVSRALDWGHPQTFYNWLSGAGIRREKAAAFCRKISLLRGWPSDEASVEALAAYLRAAGPEPEWMSSMEKSEGDYAAPEAPEVVMLKAAISIASGHVESGEGASPEDCATIRNLAGAALRLLDERRSPSRLVASAA